MRLTILFLFGFLCIGCFGSVTETTVNEALEDLMELIKSTEENGIRVLVPGIIRLLFHDCVDGCDACINPNLISNRGLDKTIQALEPLYQEYAGLLSRADFWAIASKAAFAVGVESNNQKCNNERCMTPPININFLYGRQDCPTSPSHSEDTFIPSPLQNSSVIYPWFKEQFGFSPNNVVAVMGMHTLGRAGDPFNSSWEPNNRDGISIKYFKNIADPYHNWAQKAIPSSDSGLDHDIYVWKTENNDGFALPIDMTLFRNIDVDPVTGESSCDYYTCQRAQTFAMLRRYANSAETWVSHIERLFRRIIQKTESRLRVPKKTP